MHVYAAAHREASQYLAPATEHQQRDFDPNEAHAPSVALLVC